MDKSNTLDLQTKKQLENVEEYKFEQKPIKGHPVLNWRGKRPFTSTRFYPAQLKETYGEEVNGWRNKIYWGDNLQVMSHLLKEYRGQVDLIYIDPPFDSKVDYKKKIKLRGQKAENDQTSFEDKQYTDIWTNDEYLQFMYERLALIRELLSETGSIYLHADWHKIHHLRCLMDEIFGKENFLNEVVWCYQERETSKRNYNRKHDTILFYAKNKESNYTFNPYNITEMYSPTTIKKFKYTDELSRKYRLRGKDGTNDPTEESENTYRQYLDDQQGTLPRDWFQLPILNQAANERENYPTQKPEALLERIIHASSNPGDLIFDCFMGSGTTQSVAMKLGRRFIGADINIGAIQTSVKRLSNILINELHSFKHIIGDKEEEKEINNFYTGIDVYNVNHYDVFRNPVQAKELLIEALEIQKLEGNNVYDGEKDGWMVKIMPINRIATKADLGEVDTGVNRSIWEKRQNDAPNQSVEKIQLVCMGHEADLKGQLEYMLKPFKVEIEVIDILRDKKELEFKRDSEARMVIEDGYLDIQRFYPMNLLQKLSMQKETVEDWREMVESIMIDWNYDGAVLQPQVTDVPGKKELVIGRYEVPEDAGTIRVKITDLLSESWEGNIDG